MAAKDVAGRAAGSALRATRWTSRAVRGEIVKRVGGPARARVITIFGAVLALNGADNATVGAVAPQLEHAFHIGNTKIGLLSSVALLVGAVFTIPVGMLVDRIKRVPMLSLSILLWSIASLLSAFAGSYSSLLLSRLALGAVTATAGPAIASLTGDYFPARERGRVYAYILGGEIAGTAVGFIVSGSVAAITWRAAFLLLAIPGFFLARELYRTVPEPHRGGHSWLEPGVMDLKEAVAAGPSQPPPPETEGEQLPPDEVEDLAREAVRRLGVEPDPELVLTRDPRSMGIVDAVRYILSMSPRATGSLPSAISRPATLAAPPTGMPLAALPPVPARNRSKPIAHAAPGSPAIKVDQAAQPPASQPGRLAPSTQRPPKVPPAASPPKPQAQKPCPS